MNTNTMNEFIAKCVSQEFASLPVNDVIIKEKVKIRLYICDIFSKIQKQLINHSVAEDGLIFVVSFNPPTYNNILSKIQNVLKERGYSSTINYDGNLCHLCISFV